MFQRALLPTDGSETALAAVEAAVRATTPGGGIVLLTAIPTVEDLLTQTAAASRAARHATELAEQSHETRRREAVTHLEDAARRIEAAGGQVAARLVAGGDPGPTIVRTATEEDCDVIVMTTNGRSGWKRLILGSVADYVVRHEDEIPVILVRRREDRD